MHPRNCPKQKRRFRCCASALTESSKPPTCVPDESITLEVGDREAVESALAACCQDDLTGVAPRVAMAIRYSLLGQGQRVRGLLLMASSHAARRRAGGTAAAAAA